MVVLVSGVRSKTNLLSAPAREPVPAPRPYLQRRGELVRARFGSERTSDTSTTSGLTDHRMTTVLPSTGITIPILL